MSKMILSGASIDVLYKLHKYGDQDDGDLPSKQGMLDLIDKGLAVKDYGNEKPNSATEYGLYVYVNNLYEHEVRKN